MPRRKNDIPWTLRQLLVKICLLSATIIIGLYCGLTNSYSAFYVAVLIQAINNVYESFELLTGYNKFITAFQAISFIGAGISAILAILFFCNAHLGCHMCVWIVAIALSIPVLHFLIESFILWQAGKY